MPSRCCISYAITHFAASLLPRLLLTVTATRARHLNRHSHLSTSQQNWSTTSELGEFHGMCVTTETRHLDRLGQPGEFEQDSNTDSEQKSNTGSHSARSKQSTDGSAPHSM